MTTRRMFWRERIKSKWFLRMFSGVLLMLCALESSWLDDYWIRFNLSPFSDSVSSFHSSISKTKNKEEDGTRLSATNIQRWTNNETIKSMVDHVATSETLGVNSDMPSSAQTTQQPMLRVVDKKKDETRTKASVMPPKNTAYFNASTSRSSLVGATSRLSTEDTCVTPELHGQWEFQDKATLLEHPTPFCCDIESTYPLDHEFCEHNISGDYRLKFQGQPDRLSWMGGRGCGSQCQRHFTNEFRWKSTNLRTWNATDFCARLGDRRILMVGDSTLSQAATTLMNAAHGAQCQTQMSFYLSDTLLNQEYGNLNRGEHWLDLVANHSKKEDDIIVLTVGGHVLKQRDLSRVSDIVIQQMVDLRQKRPGLQFVYKSQQPGGCTPQIANVSWTPSEAARQFPWKRKLFNFNYPLLYEYDERTIRKLQANDIPFLDLRMLYSRSDAHPYSRGRGKVTDCLHFCSPGPLDVIPSLFMRLLQRNFAVPQCV